MNDKLGRNDLCPCGSGKKYKRCCMDNKIKVKDCFGDQGGAPLNGEIPEDCLNCDIGMFDRCHKVAIATSLQGISLDLGLLTQNGLKTGWLKSFNELSQEEKTNN
jgi:hypothetical protein